MLFQAKVPPDDIQRQVVACLFLRVLEHFQGALSVLVLGMVAPARVTLRAMLEAVFAIRALVIREEYLKIFIAADSQERLKIFNKAKINGYSANGFESCRFAGD